MTCVLLQKTLHAGDPDFYAPFNMPTAAEPVVRLDAKGITGRYNLQINHVARLPVAQARRKTVPGS